ncbi:MAG TPA: anti-virulence regulator CigR family protein [Azospirillum sp.]|nr:anti-virulence regulator CigR family protein [Azospirillum sp.]
MPNRVLDSLHRRHAHSACRQPGGKGTEMLRFDKGGLMAAVLLLALGATPAFAEKGGHGHAAEHGGGHAGHDKGGKEKGGKDKGGDAAVTVRTGDRTLIQNYFTANPVGVSPLPPGIARNVARGKPLPPGIARKQAPAALVAQLPYCAGGLECIVLGADLLILDAVNGLIRDVVRGVVR